MQALTSKLSRWIIALSIAVGGVALTGCHTMEGAGKDVEKAGDKLQDAAD